MNEVRKCDVCGFDTTYSKICPDCQKVIQEFRKWLQFIKSQKKHKSINNVDLIKAKHGMCDKIEDIGRKTFSEWRVQR